MVSIWDFSGSAQLIYQIISIPFALIFYCLATKGYLSLIQRYIYLGVGGFSLAVISMGWYSAVLFVSVIMSTLLIYSVDSQKIHRRIFIVQMLWQSFWHMLLLFRLHWQEEPADPRFLLMLSSLMLLTQRVTSVSMDLEEGKVILYPRFKGRIYASHLLPYTCYTLSFVCLLGGPLCPYGHFVSFVQNIQQNPPPSPLNRVSLRLLWVFILEVIKYVLIFFLKASSVNLNFFSGLLWMWSLSLVLKITYYSHWALSECLNNAIGLGFCGNHLTGFQCWNSLSDGELWTTETSCRLSEFTRRWNGTTAAWLRRLIYQRCQTFPLGLTFGFSALWHGLHPGQVKGFFFWAVSVKADYQLHNHLSPRLTSPWIRKVYRCLSWIQTQMVMACVIITIELGQVTLWSFCMNYISISSLIYILTVCLSAALSSC
ncbi:membrane-bound ghrelin O-acyltransferase mboat4 [Alosa pseudoharengus]|uniref:membrane-bound ghrelin O-acyltransferase mboat4 n=1 Tax=Alosa pseudoharengus TaxID=34774 RepID=UPI003F88D89C